MEFGPVSLQLFGLLSIPMPVTLLKQSSNVKKSFGKYFFLPVNYIIIICHIMSLQHDPYRLFSAVKTFLNNVYYCHKRIFPPSDKTAIKFYHNLPFLNVAGTFVFQNRASNSNRLLEKK